MEMNRASLSIIAAVLLALTGCNGIPQYTYKTPVQGDQLTYAQTVFNGNNVTSSYTFTKTYTSVNSDGSATATITPDSSSCNSNGLCVSPETVTEDATGHQLSFSMPVVPPSGSDFVCTSSPVGEGFPFPLYIGKTWTADWSTTCGSTGMPEPFTLTDGIVSDIEPITVPAGNFVAIKVQYTVTYSVGAVNIGPSGRTTSTMTTTMNKTAWLDTQTGRILKSVISYSYAGFPPPFPGTGTNTIGSGPSQMTQELQSVKQSTV